MTKILLIGGFGAVGAICRYLAGNVCVRLFGTHFAYGTLAVNVVGCFLLGLVMHLMRSEAIHLSDHAHLALTAGFLGALTTFSTFGYETVHHLEEGEWALAGVNVAANLVLGLLAAGGGVAVGRAFG